MREPQGAGKRFTSIPLASTEQIAANHLPAFLSVSQLAYTIYESAISAGSWIVCSRPKNGYT